MSLLDSVLGARPAVAGASAVAQSGLLPVLVDVLTTNGGLSGLAGKFEQAGLAPILESWISKQAANLPITGEQLQRVLGADVVQGLAAKIDIDATQLLPRLSQFLPVAIDHLTPEGRIPPAGSPNASDLLKLFGNVLKA